MSWMIWPLTSGLTLRVGGQPSDDIRLGFLPVYAERVQLVRDPGQTWTKIPLGSELKGR